MDGLIACFRGRLGQDAEVKYLANGTPLVAFSALVLDSKQGADAAGEWVRVALFGEPAETLAPRLVKGTEAYCEGRLKLDRWQAADGAQRSALKLTAWTVQPLGQIGRRVPREARIAASERRASVRDGAVWAGG